MTIQNVYSNVRSYSSNLDVYSNTYIYAHSNITGFVYYISLNININFKMTLIR